ncbi:MAG: hypothetical protein LBK41_06815 [Clostridiales bacterium]|jgi:hypothetical protein|nr:hypothetical protein [Clostridiales bacterium]
MEYKQTSDTLADQLSELDETVRQVLTAAAALLLGALAVGLLVSPNKIGYGLGLVLGAVVFAGKLLLLRGAVVKESGMAGGEAKNHARLTFAYRYFLTMAALALFAAVPFIDAAGGAVGLMLPSLALYAARLRRKPKAVV